MRLTLPLMIALVASSMSVSAPAGTPIAPPAQPPSIDLRASRPVVLTGNLLRLRNWVQSGDYSGWVLIKSSRSFNLDVRAVQAQAVALGGQNAVIRGQLTTGHFADGTPFQQVRVTSIQPSP